MKSDQNHLFEGILKDYEQTMIEFFRTIGETKSADLRRQDIMSYLFIHKELTQKQLHELTGSSLSTISKILRQMVKLHIFEKKSIPKTNKKIYNLKGGNIAELLKAQMETLPTFLSMITDSVNKTIDEIKPHREKEGGEFLISRLKEFNDACDQAINLIPELIKVWSE